MSRAILVLMTLFFFHSNIFPAPSLYVEPDTIDLGALVEGQGREFHFLLHNPLPQTVRVWVRDLPKGMLCYPKSVTLAPESRRPVSVLFVAHRQSGHRITLETSLPGSRELHLVVRFHVHDPLEWHPASVRRVTAYPGSGRETVYLLSYGSGFAVTGVTTSNDMLKAACSDLPQDVSLPIGYQGVQAVTFVYAKQTMPGDYSDEIQVDTTMGTAILSVIAYILPAIQSLPASVAFFGRAPGLKAEVFLVHAEKQAFHVTGVSAPDSLQAAVYATADDFVMRVEIQTRQAWDAQDKLLVELTTDEDRQRLVYIPVYLD